MQHNSKHMAAGKAAKISEYMAVAAKEKIWHMVFTGHAFLAFTKISCALRVQNSRTWRL